MKIRINQYRRIALESLLDDPLPHHMLRRFGFYERSFSGLVGAGLVELKDNSYGFPTYYITSLGRKALRCAGTDVEFDTVNPNCPPSIGKDKVIPVIPEPKKKVFPKYIGTQGSTVAFHKLFGDK